MKQSGIKTEAEKSSVKRITGNVFFSILNQVFVTLAPLLTTPYVNRVLGAEKLGVYTFTLTNVNYFVLFAMLGLAAYGTRTIAENSDSPENISKHFWQIYTIQFFTSVLCIILYGFYLLSGPQNLLIAAIQIFWLFSALMDFGWFFYGIEEVKLMALRSTLVKILTIAGIFIFVHKDANALVSYTLIMALGNWLGMISVVPLLRRFVQKPEINPAESKVHLKPILILFIPILAMSVFHNMDKTMLGVLSSYSELGYYRNADLIINVPLGIVNVLASVFLPRSSALYSDGKQKEWYGFLDHTFELTVFLAILLAFGIAGCAKDFVPIFLGEEFIPCIALTYVFVPVLVIKAISNFYRMEYLIPRHMEKTYVIATFGGAIANIIFNAILIPKLGALGAVLGTLIAEGTLMIIQMFPKDTLLPYFKWLIAVAVYCVIGIVMFYFMQLIAGLHLNVIYRILMEIAAGGIFYLVCCLIYWRYISKNKEIMDLIRLFLPKR